ncbi:putative acid phosphatase [Atractiella rhizophila]|nr:putative acid phosphatase [Atractiella rhizophila]
MSMKVFVLCALTLAGGAFASPFAEKRQAAKATFTVFPAAGTSASPDLFPDESQVGYPGPTATGAEPLAIATAPAYAGNGAQFFPLVAAGKGGNATASGNPATTNTWNIFKKWGNLSPWYTVPSAFYGLDDTSPIIPKGCEIQQVHILYRHGARYPTSGSLPSSFASKVANTSFTATGGLSFLNNWTYALGAELLTPFGRLQNFELGVGFRQMYGGLLDKFVEQGTIPVFRTESQDRMVKTAQNFAAGFFGVPEFLEQVNIEIVVETPGLNNTGAPYETCTNSNVASRGSIGSSIAANYSKIAFASTVERLQAQVHGLNLTATDVVSMLQLCSYETDALGYSPFCGLFDEDEFEKYEYYYDLSFYYNNGFGSPVAAAQGKGYLEEFVARFQMHKLDAYNSTTNQTFDDNPVYFPLNQSIYADATHEVVVLDTLTALNLTALGASGPLPTTQRPSHQSFVASQTVPFATHLVIQVLNCPARETPKQIRFILNDAVLPIDKSYPGCQSDKDGLCAFDTVLHALEQRVQEIDFDYDCFANYTATPGVDYNGRAPRNANTTIIA